MPLGRAGDASGNGDSMLNVPGSLFSLRVRGLRLMRNATQKGVYGGGDRTVMLNRVVGVEGLLLTFGCRQNMNYTAEVSD